MIRHLFLLKFWINKKVCLGQAKNVTNLLEIYIEGYSQNRLTKNKAKGGCLEIGSGWGGGGALY